MSNYRKKFSNKTSNDHNINNFNNYNMGFGGGFGGFGGMNHFDDFINQAFNDDFFNDPFIDFHKRNSSFGPKMLGFNNNQENELGISNFSRFNSGFNIGSGVGTVISKSYVSTTKLDENGNPIRKEFKSQGFDQYNKDGTKISEKHQAYRDSEKGVKKASQQRLLNDVGQKIIKTKDYKNNNELEDHYYHNMNEGKFFNFNFQKT